METHAEHSKRIRNATPCTAHDITFGGRCLACGYDPNNTMPDTGYICPDCDAGDPTSVITECTCND